MYERTFMKLTWMIRHCTCTNEKIINAGVNCDVLEYFEGFLPLEDIV